MEKSKRDWFGIKGPVKEYRQYVSRIDKTTGELIKSPFPRKKYTFNKKGFYLTADDYDAHGISKWHDTYFYLNDELLLLSLGFNIKNELSMVYTYQYDPKGREILRCRFDPQRNHCLDEKEVTEYEDTNHTSECKLYDQFGKLMTSVVKRFDANGFNTETTKVNFERDYDSNCVKIKYDSRGNIIEWLSLDYKGQVFYEEFYKYDLQNYVTEKIHRSGIPIDDYHYQYEYTYDKDFNILERITLNKGIFDERRVYVYDTRGNCLEENVFATEVGDHKQVLKDYLSYEYIYDS